MKKWMFVIFPGILLLIFLFFYQQTSAEMQAREQAHATELARQKAADAEHKQMIEDKAKKDADERAAQQAAEEAQKAADAAAKKKKVRDAIQAETDSANAQIDHFTKQIADLQAQLDKLDEQKKQESLADFDFAKKVELARVNERNSELEIQRMVDMIAQRTAKSWLTKLPTPPPPSD
jgi:hypothetical protein